MNKMIKLAAAILAATLGASAIAHELDRESATAQAEIAQALPQTTVVRVSKTDPSKVEVVHLESRLQPGQQAKGVKFEQIALATEIAGIKFDSGNELDATSSTSSWRYGWAPNASSYYWGYRAPRYYGNAYRGYYAPQYYAPSAYYANPYYVDYRVGAPSYYTVSDPCYGSSAYVNYRVGPYSYVARPYYSYADSYYSYTYFSGY